MTEKSSENFSSQEHEYLDVSRDIFSVYRERYEKEKKDIVDETGSKLRKYLSELIGKIGPTKLPEKISEQKYDELSLSLVAKDYLEKNKEHIEKENPDTSCMIIYLPGKSARESQATKLCIPRSNPTNSPISIAPFILTPVPKSNGYNTEYNIVDQK